MWIQPLAVVQKFVANEYVAACWSVTCKAAYENLVEYNGKKDRGYDSFHIGDMNNLHQQSCCGAEDAFELVVDENGNAVELVEVKEHTGSTGRTKPLGTVIYSDPEYTQKKDIKDVKVGDTIYFTTSNNNKTWHHYGEVKGNHS